MVTHLTMTVRSYSEPIKGFSHCPPADVTYTDVSWSRPMRSLLHSVNTLKIDCKHMGISPLCILKPSLCYCSSRRDQNILTLYRNLQ